MRADSLVFQIRHNAKPQNDIDHAMATVRNQTERQKMKRTVIFGQAVFAILRKSKREETPHTSQRRCFTFAFTQPHPNIQP